MKTAYETAAESLRKGRSLEQIALDTKKRQDFLEL